MAEPAEAPAARRRSFWRELPILVAVALILALLIKAFAVQAYRIPSGSMEDTLLIGDRVLVNKAVYDFRGIDRGDIVVFNGQGSWDPAVASAPSESAIPRGYHDVLRWVGLETDGTDYIKRVIGLPGDRVVCCNSDGQITVNGVPLHESAYLYPGSNPSLQQFKIVVPPGRLWVMGDHRADSADSRYHMEGPGEGTIPINEVVGRAFVVIWPPSQLQMLPIPGTFKQAALEAAGTTAPVMPLAGGIVGAVPAVWMVRRFRRRRRSDS
ncbi:MAG TPA: signal peptidase I [Streptosporangiaceae bacterium]|nr:signal peptidase I [Streptosporangiaceae bacterium]